MTQVCRQALESQLGRSGVSVKITSIGVLRAQLTALYNVRRKVASNCDRCMVYSMVTGIINSFDGTQAQRVARCGTVSAVVAIALTNRLCAGSFGELPGMSCFLCPLLLVTLLCGVPLAGDNQ